MLGIVDPVIVEMEEDGKLTGQLVSTSHMSIEQVESLLRYMKKLANERGANIGAI